MGALDVAIGDPNFRARFREDFLTSNFPIGFSWNPTVSGAGSFANIDNTLSNGVVRLTSGTTVSRVGAIFWAGQQLSPANMRYFKTRLKNPVSGNEIMSIGIGDYAAPITINNGIYFEKTNSGNWLGVCESAGVRATVSLIANDDINNLLENIYLN